MFPVLLHDRFLGETSPVLRLCRKMSSPTMDDKENSGRKENEVFLPANHSEKLTFPSKVLTRKSAKDRMVLYTPAPVQVPGSGEDIKEF